MSDVNTKKTIKLRVLNGEMLEVGKSIGTLMTEDGGYIGSFPSNHWCLQTKKETIADIHAKVEVIDSYFCISACNADLLINGSRLTSSNKSVRLQHGDIVDLNGLKINVQTNDITADEPVIKAPHELISTYADPMDEIMNKKSSHHLEEYSHTISTPEQQVLSGTAVDPMMIFEQEATAKKEDVHFVGSTPLYVNNNEALQPLDDTMEHSYLKFSSHQEDINTDDINERHLAITPLLRGLNTSIVLKDTQQAYNFLYDVGYSLRTVIKGLQDLQRSNESLSDKHLRPIEDNPLRLKMDYDETLLLLYSSNNHAVHLSAPYAIAESLQNVRIHNDANKIAISDALSALLDALSPAALLSRFVRYRRTYDTRPTDNVWAWDMFSNYYRELCSNRQQGFEKLFWEIYEQSYDKAIRRLQFELQDTPIL